MIKAVKGTRDILPPASAVWNQVEAVAREVFRTYNYQEIRTPLFEETALFARGVGEDTDIVGKEMYTCEDRDGSFAHAAPGSYRFGDARLYRASPRPDPGRQEVLLHRPDVPPRAPAEGPLPPVLSDRRGGHRLGIAGRRCRSDRDGGGAAAPRRAGRFQAAPQFRRRCRTAARRIMALLREKLADVAPKLCGDCQRRADDQSAARARLQGSRGSADHRHAAFDSRSSVRRLPRALRRGAAASATTAASPTKCGRAWCAAWITTCAPRSRSRTALWARRIPFWAAAATTGWRKRSARKFPRPASASRSAKTAW